jgi:hypothetical protein
VRADGVLVACTYIREHQIFGWHRHDTDGAYENVCVVPEGDEDALYCVVNRRIGSEDYRYVERFTSRRVDDMIDYIGMDSALTYDGRNASSAATKNMTMTLSGGTSWAYDETITLTSSGAFFQNADIGNQIWLYDPSDVNTVIRFTITQFTSGTVVKGKPHKTVPTTLRNEVVKNWTRAVDQLSGMEHLEGKLVSVLGDGFVVANPNNEAYVQVQVVGGVVTLERPYGVIHVGLPFLSDIQTLDIDTPQGETIADKKKYTGAVTMHLEASRGLFVGPKPPEENVRNLTDDLVYDLYELKIREDESMDEPPRLISKQVTVNLAAEWNSNGRVFIRQIDPLPLTVLSVAPGGEFPFRG